MRRDAIEAHVEARKELVLAQDDGDWERAGRRVEAAKRRIAETGAALAPEERAEAERRFLKWYREYLASE
ncbi:MAG: hypothetical protein QJR08_00560 [Bacillota bacterium]|nr:hypothetical protein [Bacillota bacterium]